MGNCSLFFFLALQNQILLVHDIYDFIFLLLHSQIIREIFITGILYHLIILIIFLSNLYLLYFIDPNHYLSEYPLHFNHYLLYMK